MRLEEIQRTLREEKLDGWLLFDHHRRDPLSYRVLQFTPDSPVTRRWYYFIPSKGEPKGLVHRIESHTLDSLPGKVEKYAEWSEMVERLRAMLEGARLIAMQYSPDCAVPYVSLADAGTVELIRGMGVKVASSANLIQIFEARWSERQLESHLEAGRRVDQIRREAFERIGARQRAGERVTEWEMQQFILERYRTEGLVIDHGPDVAVNGNASNPHYEPKREASAEIRKGDLVLLDLWAKLEGPESVYYDITWVGYCGGKPPAEMERVFEIVREARDRAIKRVEEAVAAKQELRGYEVDDAARSYIREQGFGDYFFHRTGHSIGTEVHGTSANMDNLETHDDRKIIPWTCFSIEPGIYLPAFGVRSEVDVFVDESCARVTGDVQKHIVAI